MTGAPRARRWPPHHHRDAEGSPPARRRSASRSADHLRSIVLPAGAGARDGRRSACSDVLPDHGWLAPSYSFLRQSVRNLLAAPVAEGGTKPTSIVCGRRGGEPAAGGRAHQRADRPLPPVDDAGQLCSVSSRTSWSTGLRKAVETEVLSGDGTGEHFTGILNTSRASLRRAFATDALTSIRKAIDRAGRVRVRARGRSCLSAADWEAIELLMATTAAPSTMQGVPMDATARRLWGVPVVLNQGLGAKTGLVIGPDAVTIDHDGRVDTAMVGRGRRPTSRPRTSSAAASRAGSACR